MTKFVPHTIDTAPEGARDSLRQAEEQFGFVPNMMAVLAESPAALEAYQTIQGAFSKTSFSAAEQQFVALVVSVTNDCTYCVPAYSLFAAKTRVPQEVIDAARDGGAIDDGRYSVLRDFTTAVVEKRGAVDDAEVQAFLDAGFTQAQVLEVIIGVAFKTISNYTNHIAHIPLDDAFQPFRWDGEKAA